MPGPLIAELTARAVIAPGIAELSFAMRSPERLVFRAGQFVSLGLVAGEARRRDRRLAAPQLFDRLAERRR